MDLTQLLVEEEARCAQQPPSQLLTLARAVQSLQEQLRVLRSVAPQSANGQPAPATTQQDPAAQQKALASIWQPVLDALGAQSVRGLRDGQQSFLPMPESTARRCAQLLADVSTHLIESGSIEIHRLTTAEVAAVPIREHAIIIDDALQLADTLTIEGEKFFAKRASEKGVEWIGEHQLRYRVTSEEKIASVEAAAQKRANDIAACKKQLVDLPAALDASKKRTAELTASEDDSDLAQIGATILEQKRLNKEIAQQQALLAELEASPVPTLSAENYTLIEKSQLLTTPFGQQVIAGRVFNITPATKMPTLDVQIS